VLEAGCGSTTHVRFPGGFRLTGIDISQAQLDRHTGLDVKILGDLQSDDLGVERFDVIVCWDVLEHLERPMDALENFVRALRPGGLIVLAMPHVRSVKGLITRFTPHRVHVWVYRRFFNDPLAGTGDTGPFPTFMRGSLAPRRIRSLAARRGLRVPYTHEYEAWSQKELRQRAHLTGAVWRAVAATLRALTLGRVRADVSDVVLVIQKPSGAEALAMRKRAG
jgi:SAM-dependent methyltransferase